MPASSKQFAFPLSVNTKQDLRVKQIQPSGLAFRFSSVQTSMWNLGDSIITLLSVGLEKSK